MVDRGCQAQKLMKKHKIIYISSLMIRKNMPFEFAKFEKEKPRKFE